MVYIITERKTHQLIIEDGSFVVSYGVWVSRVTIDYRKIYGFIDTYIKPSYLVVSCSGL